MKLEIINIISEGMPDENWLDISYYIIKKKLAANKIQVAITKSPKGIMFNEQEHEDAGKKLFMSSVDNKIPLKPTDARYKEAKPYLKTRKLTAKQFDSLFDTFNKTFDNLKLKADVRLYEDDKDLNSFVSIRAGSTNGEWPSKPTKPPVAMSEKV